MISIDVNTSAIADLAREFASFGPKLPNAQALVINRVITRTKARVIPALTAQTGLSRKIVTRAVKTLRAAPTNPRGALLARGGNISLRYFGAREVPGGVTATVRGKTVTLEGHYFRRSGRAPNRYLVRKLNGQVFFSTSGKWGIGADLEVRKSGVFIGADLVDGASKQAFLDTVEQDLPIEIATELLKLLPGR